MRLIFLLGLLLVLGACAARPVHAPLPAPAVSVAPAFVDLHACWRLRVVVPILKSGGYRLHSLESNGQNFGNLRTDQDFVGYENDYYAVTKRRQGVSIEFQSAEVVTDGKTTAQSRPLVSLFNLPRNIRYVRLVYLVRVSDADHNMAIVGAENPETLATVTSELQTNPDHTCEQGAHSFCSWVPVGISVRPQQLTVNNGQQEWGP